MSRRSRKWSGGWACKIAMGVIAIAIEIEVGLIEIAIEIEMGLQD